jgi:hypothetical protein
MAIGGYLTILKFVPERGFNSLIAFYISYLVTFFFVSIFLSQEFFFLVLSVSNNSKPHRAQSSFYGPHDGIHREAQF